MIVRYIYSSCIVIETRDLRICCDPWFTQGIYDGSWYQYPVVEDPVGAIGHVDFVYISHIHPDHYDPPSLQAIMRANPDCQILIGDKNQVFLRSKMLRDGLSPRSIGKLVVGQTRLAVIPCNSYTEQNIDSALVVDGDGSIVVNMNDCPFDEDQVKGIQSFCGRAPDLACLPYAGAGPTPQTYRFLTETERLKATDRKKEQFLHQFERYLSALQPRWALPFAGLYYLGRKLRVMNPLRGIPDAVEVKKRFGEKVLVLREGDGQIDLSSDLISGERTEPYDVQERDRALSEFDALPMPYENEPSPSEAQLVALLGTAHRNAIARIRDFPSRPVLFKCPETRFMCVDHRRPGVVDVLESAASRIEREEIHIDSRLFYGLLNRKYHWNNAEIGSHFGIFRRPEVYDRRVYHLLTFLHV
jgi:UDP-MurNAc hydroxylase